MFKMPWKKQVDKADIKRLGRQNEWLPGPCAYCEGQGFVDSKMPENIPVDKVDLAFEFGPKELIVSLYEKTVQLIVDGKNDSEILAELEREGAPKEIAQKILDDVKKEVNKVKANAHREVAGEYLLKGSGFLILGAVVTGITYSMASGGGTYIVTTGLFVVGGLYVVMGLFKYLSNL